MPCYKPLQAFSYVSGRTTKNTIRFTPPGKPIELPCGRCIGCRLEKSRDWALRCTHENQYHDDHSCFITLTYDNKNLPAHASLHKSHFSKFIRSLRQRTKQKIRYYMCGEYGKATEENNWIARPHYHAILFGYKFPDAYFSNTRNGNRVYRSPLLEEKWPYGRSEIGSVTFQSAAYIARYIMTKQIDSEDNSDVVIDRKTGEIIGTRIHEYTNMSLRPGIGYHWYQKYKNAEGINTELFPHDYALTPEYRQMPVPQYYRNLLKIDNPELHEKLKLARIEKAQDNPDNSPERLAVRKICQEDKLKRLTRDRL